MTPKTDFPFQLRAWFGLTVAKSIALRDALYCAGTAAFPFVVGMPIGWKVLAIPFFIGAAVRGWHVITGERSAS